MARYTLTVGIADDAEQKALAEDDRRVVAAVLPVP